MQEIIKLLQKWNKDEDLEATINRITKMALFGRDRVENMLYKLPHTGRVGRRKVDANGNKTHEDLLKDNQE